MKIQKLDVHFQHSDTDKTWIGTLAIQNRALYFEYADSFLCQSHYLSPYHLTPDQAFHEFRPNGHLETWGLFDDSLPDGWGLMLMDRFFQSQGIPLRDLSILSRLAYLGTRTMGALTYHPSMHDRQEAQKTIDLWKTATEVEAVLEGKSEDILDDLFQLGGSPGGARPKILVGRKENHLIAGVHDLPEGFEHWILKFHARKDNPEEGLVEQIYAEMARAAGLEIPKTSLFYEPKRRRHYFAIQRFDRQNGQQRIHIHSFANLIHSNFRYPSQDYTQLMALTRNLTKKQSCVEKVFRQMVFNILMNNRDDHDKNFSFRYDYSQAEWFYAPSYDLTFCRGLGRLGEHSMLVAGEALKPGRSHVMTLASDHHISTRKAETIITDVKESTLLWDSLARKYDLSTKTSTTIQQSIQQNIKRF